MAKSTSKTETDQPIYVRVPVSLLRRIDRRVEKERKDRKGEVDEKSITRSSVIRSAVVRMLDGAS